MIKIFRSYLLLSIFTLNLVNAADDCKEIDLYQSKTSPLINMPILDQGPASTCYSFVAAQMLDYYNLKLKKYSGTYKFTSPLYLAWLAKYKNKFFFPDSTLFGGRSEELLETDIKESGVCSEEEVAIKINKFAQTSGITESMFYEILEYLKNFQYYFDINPANEKRMLKEMGGMITCEKAVQLQHIFKNNLDLFEAPLKVLDSVFKGCNGHVRYTPSVEMTNDLNDSDLADFVGRNLENDYPNAIEFCHRFISDKNYRGFEPIRHLFMYKQFSGQRHGDCDPHTVLVVGRKKDQNGQCQYLLRNSAGAKWYPETASSCACITKRGDYKSECDKTEGQTYLGCWFPKDKVLKNTYQINSIK